MKARYQRLAAANAAHFVAPRGRDASGQPLPPAGSEGSAGRDYHDLHEAAILAASQAGRTGGKVSHALAMEAAAQHFLTDAFSAGHLRTPIGLIRDHWSSVYPLFWYNVRHKIALDTAIRMNAQTTNPSTMIGTVQMMYEAISAQVEAMSASLPALTLGDLLAKVFHDFDNRAGLAVSGGRVYGDSHLDDPDPRNLTRKLATQAVQAGKRDIEKAFKLGKAGSRLADRALFAAVRASTGAKGTAYAAELLIPRPSTAEPGQNWYASSIEALWDKPMVGTKGPTVGDEIILSLQPGGEVRSEIEALANKFPPVQQRRTGDVRPRQAYMDGFVGPLVAAPKRGILSIVHWAPNYGLRGVDRDDISLVTGQELQRQGNLAGMTTEARVSYIRELIGGSVAADEEELVVQIFETAPPSKRPVMYRNIEGHAWTGDWIHGAVTSDDELWNALSRSRLRRLRDLINAGR